MSDSAAEWVGLDALRPWADNPRDNEAAVQTVADSIKRFGFASPIIARREDGEVIAGHTRLKAARRLGLDRVPVRYMDLDPTDARLLALADNKLGELADWSDGLADVLRILEEDGADLDGLGFSDEEMAELLGPDPIEPDGTEDDVPEVQSEVHSQAGEVYELGPHRLMCGDCRASTDVSTLLEGVVVNVAFTSPPYASQRKYDESSGFKPIKPAAYVGWFDAVQANVREHLAEDGSWFVNIKEHCEDGQRHLYVKDLTIAHVRAWGWMWVDEFCWSHGGTPKAVQRRFKNGWEPVFQFAVDPSFKFNPKDVRHKSVGPKLDWGGRRPSQNDGHGLRQVGSNATLQGSPSGGKSIHDAVAASMEEGLAYPSNVISPGKNKEALGHGAAFPVGLPAFFVKAYSDEGGAIFDPFMGSGTTLIAAAQERRVAYGMEISPGYCDVIRRRWTRWAIKHGQDPGSGALADAG